MLPNPRKKAKLPPKLLELRQETGGIICTIENLPVGYGQVAEVT